jgi:uroporphyrinogen III methyltransferase/synthase
MTTVYLVGAGPGDPSLISVRGMRRLSQADVVVHDHLVHPRLLRSAPANAERIDVGAAAPQPLEQEAICLLLAEKAREGRVVVRLKWGDPYFFDSGGKEALFLHEQGIPFEVVPGIPATIASATYAGVPLTYPGAGDTLTFIRGHEDGSNLPPRIDWESLARLEGTIVCYAGARQLAGIVNNLLTHGRSEDDGATIIQDGTLPRQRTQHGTLGELARKLDGEALRAPAMLIVGRVSQLREHLRWYDARPLFGRRIIVTRAREQAGDLIEQLEELGAETIEAPSLRIEPMIDETALDIACRGASEFDWIVFTSVNGVEHFMRCLMDGPGDVRSLKGPRLCAVGPATAERLGRYGLKIDLMPAEFHAEGVAEALRGTGTIDGARVLLPKADIAREVLADELRKAGAEVTEVVAYRTVPEHGTRDTDPDIYKMLLEHQIDVVTFTSASSVRHFVKLIGEEQATDLLAGTLVASIGPVTAEAAQQMGIETKIMPKEYTVPALVQAIVEAIGGDQANGGVSSVAGGGKTREAGRGN